MATATAQVATSTRVKNTSGATRFFGFLGDKGRTLTANQIVTMPGQWPGSIRNDHRRNPRDYDAAVIAIDAGRLTLVSGPELPQDNGIVTGRVDSATVIAVGDMVWLDTDDIKPASAFTWDTDLATTQGAFAAKFLGIAVDASANGQTTPIRVDTSPAVRTVTCASQTLEVGKTLAPAKDTGNALVNQTLAAAVAAAAIFRSSIYAAGAQTTVTGSFASAYTPASANVNAAIG